MEINTVWRDIFNSHFERKILYSGIAWNFETVLRSVNWMLKTDITNIFKDSLTAYRKKCPYFL
jgi:hypothetical protein